MQAVTEQHDTSGTEQVGSAFAETPAILIEFQSSSFFFFQFLQTNFGTVPQTGSRLLPSRLLFINEPMIRCCTVRASDRVANP